LRSATLAGRKNLEVQRSRRGFANPCQGETGGRFQKGGHPSSVPSFREKLKKTPSNEKPSSELCKTRNAVRWKKDRKRRLSPAL